MNNKISFHTIRIDNIPYGEKLFYKIIIKWLRNLNIYYNVNILQVLEILKVPTTLVKAQIFFNFYYYYSFSIKGNCYRQSY